MEFSSFFFHLLFFSQIFQFSNTIVSSAKVQIPAQNAPTDKLDSLTGQVDEKDTDIEKRLVQQRIKRDSDDVVYIDHRLSGCLSDPRSQGGCFASYAFATIAFYEWVWCRTNGRFQAFSEQYIIDCGHRDGNFGCNGGYATDAMIFSDKCGLVTQEYYPFRGEQRECPYSDSTSSLDMGQLRMVKPYMEFIPLNRLARYLVYGPIIAVSEIGIRFLSYTGGVDDNVDHTPGLLHTMLLIGHGRENGQEYWLFKNSYFTPSVNDGYYKLNKNVNCFKGGLGLSLPIPGPI